MTTKKTRVPVRAEICLLTVLLTLTGGCSRRQTIVADETNTSASNSSANASASNVTSDPAQLNADIARLEKEAEKNPGDEDAREALSQAYVRRGNVFRDAQQPREALLDYQRALRNNPDNLDAQKNVAEISPLVEGTPTAENGEPAPLPITPNVTDDDDEQKTTPTPTPKKP